MSEGSSKDRRLALRLSVDELERLAQLVHFGHEVVANALPGEHDEYDEVIQAVIDRADEAGLPIEDEDDIAEQEEVAEMAMKSRLYTAMYQIAVEFSRRDYEKEYGAVDPQDEQAMKTILQNAETYYEFLNEHGVDCLSIKNKEEVAEKKKEKAGRKEET